MRRRTRTLRFFSVIDISHHIIKFSLWINIERISMAIRCMSPHRDDAAWSHQRANERDADPSSILEFTRNEVDEGHVYLGQRIVS